jgi:short-subunit dehydrogenase
LAGQLTTVDVGRVANMTLDAALRGRAVVIPGFLNRMLQMLGSLMPAQLVAGLIGSRWSAVREKRMEEASGSRVGPRPLPAEILLH